MRKDRIEFWVKVAGWSGLLSAFGVLMFYQLTGMRIFLVHLIIIILFSAYTITYEIDGRYALLFRFMIPEMIQRLLGE